MKKLLAPVVILALTLTTLVGVEFWNVATTKAAGWYDSNYTYCRKMTATAGGNVGGVATTTSASYTLYASTTQSTFKTVGNGGHIQLTNSFTGTSSTTAEDIVITNGTDCNTDGGTKLPFYVEDYNGATGDISLWVAADNISSTSAKTILIYYGNASATNQENKTGAMGTDGVVASYTFGYPDLQTNVQDTSGNGYNAGLINFTSTTTVRGQLGQALSFKASSSQTAQSFANGTTLGANWTEEGWFYLNSTPASEEDFIAKGSDNRHMGVFANAGVTDAVAWNGGFAYVSNAAISTGRWYYLVIEFNAGGTESDGYINGVLDNKRFGSNGLDSASKILLGGIASLSRFFDGPLDNLRMYNQNLAPMDILTNYNAEVNSAKFWTWGAEETKTAAASTSGEGYTIIFSLYMKAEGRGDDLA